jgi:hypothetical protein
MFFLIAGSAAKITAAISLAGGKLRHFNPLSSTSFHFMSFHFIFP